MKIDPKDAGAWIGKGNVLVNLGKYNEAIECYDKALECYDKALETDPNNERAMWSREILLMQMEEQSDKSSMITKKKIKWYTSDGKPVYE